jgi:hypothetical protein
VPAPNGHINHYAHVTRWVMVSIVVVDVWSDSLGIYSVRSRPACHKRDHTSIGIVSLSRYADKPIRHDGGGTSPRTSAALKVRVPRPPPKRRLARCLATAMRQFPGV